MGTTNFDYKEARRYCMSYGMKIALCWSATFLCSMYGMRVVLLSDVGLVIGLYSVYYAGRLIRDYNKENDNSSMLRTWWMSFLTYIFAALCTTLVEYLYFRYLDGGMLAERLEMALQIPAYRQMFEELSGEDFEQAMAVFSNPSQLAYGMFMLNVTLGFILSIPTMMIGCIGLKKEKDI